MLTRWLTEEAQWSAEAAEQLAIEYEHERLILEEYDKQLERA